MASPEGWSTVEIDRHECQVYQPRELNPHEYTIIYLHGVHLSSLVGKQPFIAGFELLGTRVICPRAARSWWTDRICEEFDPRMTAERYVIERVLPWIETTWNARPPQIALLGTSMGGQGALRFSFKHPRLFPTVAAISPAIDYHLRMNEGDETLPLMYDDPEQARQDTATLHVHPLNWPRNIWFCCDPADFRWHESAERLRMKLAALGIPYECDLETAGGGHGFEYYNRMAGPALKFIAARLESERLRV
ncbi:MAG TPA: alpha/beta hydrolase-fold protein [Pirellulales bacterium]|jgi:S-formylglutathione hydrolase FrmB|nr:alpha/beta hydrolase-fold protein [Pirellulales bacterium]